MAVVPSSSSSQAYFGQEEGEPVRRDPEIVADLATAKRNLIACETYYRAHPNEITTHKAEYVLFVDEKLHGYYKSKEDAEKAFDGPGFVWEVGTVLESAQLFLAHTVKFDRHLAALLTARIEPGHDRGASLSARPEFMLDTGAARCGLSDEMWKYLRLSRKDIVKMMGVGSAECFQDEVLITIDSQEKRVKAVSVGRCIIGMNMLQYYNQRWEGVQRVELTARSTSTDEVKSESAPTQLQPSSELQSSSSVSSPSVPPAQSSAVPSA